MKTANDAVKHYQQALRARELVLDEYREVRDRLAAATLRVDHALSFVRTAKLPATHTKGPAR